MSDALFSVLDVAPAASNRAGYRLHCVGVYNWGTFDGQIWRLTPARDTMLLTGDIGSGKSTMVDAITTLLMPAHRIAYNKAAGAESKERSLRSYVEGHYRSERSEKTGASKPVGLRDSHSYSVILGVFRNEGYGESVTLAQVFHQREDVGQPDRFFLVAPSEMSIAGDFSDFGSNFNALRSRLRKAGAAISDSYPEYGRKMRRLLGIHSEQAMDLFLQTVSMKSVGNLNEFVRSHMLEKMDVSKAIENVVSHFENLTEAHRAVRRATKQLEILDPLVASLDDYDAVVAKYEQLTARKQAVRPYVLEQLVRVARAEIAAREEELVRRGEAKQLLEKERRELTEQRDHLIVRQAQAGGGRLTELPGEILACEDELAERSAANRRFQSELTQAGLAEVTSAEELRERHREILILDGGLDKERKQIQQRMYPLQQKRSELREKKRELGEEIRGIQERANNLPTALVRLREMLCRELRLSESDLPFAGELIEVSPENEAWRTAAERALHGFALSLLVPERIYLPVSRWINSHHLGTRLVFQRVAERRVRNESVRRGDGLMLRDILVLEPGEFERYMDGELERRFAYRLVESVEEMNRENQAVTREGLIRSGSRHEKDDRRRAGDPRSWVLGRASEKKLQALEADLAALERAQEENEQLIEALGAEDSAFYARTLAVKSLVTFESWAKLDVAGSLARLTSLQAELKRLTEGTPELTEINRRLDQLTAEDGRLSFDLEVLSERIGGINNELAALRRRRSAAEREISGLVDEILDKARLQYPALEKQAVAIHRGGSAPGGSIAGGRGEGSGQDGAAGSGLIGGETGRSGMVSAPMTIDELERLGMQLESELDARMATLMRRQSRLTGPIIQRMTDVLN